MISVSNQWPGEDHGANPNREIQLAPRSLSHALRLYSLYPQEAAALAGFALPIPSSFRRSQSRDFQQHLLQLRIVF